jgi:hypothetical protein
LDRSAIHCVILFLARFSTPLFYKQTDEMHFSKQAIGNLGVFSGGFAILASDPLQPTD